MLVGGSMVLQEVEVSQIIKCSFIPYIYPALLCRSAFQVPFQVHKNKLSSYVSNMLWQMVLKEV